MTESHTAAPPPTTSQVFTIAQTTTRASPEFPFPFPFGKKRDMMSRDEGEELDDEDLDDEDLDDETDQ